VCLACVLHLPSGRDGAPTAEQMRKEVLGLTSCAVSEPTDTPEQRDRAAPKTKTQLLAERSVFKLLLQAVVAASADEDLVADNASGEEFVENVARHMALLYTTGGTAGPPAVHKATSPVSLKELDPILFLDALVGVLSEGKLSQQKAALHCLQVLVETLLKLSVARRRHKSAVAALPAAPDAGATATPMDVTAAAAPAASPVPAIGAAPTPATGGSPASGAPPSSATGSTAGAAASQPPTAPQAPTGVAPGSTAAVAAAAASGLQAVFPEIMPRVLHCCYGGKWSSLLGGVMAINTLISSSIPVEFLQSYEPSMVRGLLHVLRRLPEHCTMQAEEVLQVLTKLLKTCNPEASDRQHQATVRVLTEELFSASSGPAARAAVEMSLKLLAQRTGNEVQELLEPHYLSPLQGVLYRPLQHKPVEAQMETVAALNFCLSLRPPLLKENDDILNTKMPDVLLEALKIAEQGASGEDPVANAGRPPLPQPINVGGRNALIVQLRTACIELLCTAMAWGKIPALANNTNDLRTRAIAMFFKSLTCQTPEIVVAAKEGLRQVINQQKLPKELLQSSLRPILGPICAHHKHLTLPLLRGLARLLELLSNWFNVTLGEKLLQHLERWNDIEKLMRETRLGWKPGEEAKIANGLINLFHLLPPAAVKFLDSLVTQVIQLEGVLPNKGTDSELCSPYRVSLTRFLSRYSEQAVEYFMKVLTKPAFFSRFRDMIKSEVGAPLRDELAKSTEMLLSYAFQSQQQPPQQPHIVALVNQAVVLREQINATYNVLASTQPAEIIEFAKKSVLQVDHPPDASAEAQAKAAKAAGRQLMAQQQEQLLQVQAQISSTAYQADDVLFQGVHLVSTMCKVSPEWLKSQRQIVEMLRALWMSKERLAGLKNEESLASSHLLQSKRLVKCLLTLVQQDRGEVDVLFELLSIFSARTRVDFTFFKEYLATSVADDWSAAERRKVLTHFLYLFSSSNTHQEHLVHALQLLVIPMLTDALAKDRDEARQVVDDDTIVRIIREVLDSTDEPRYEEPLRIELLQLATLLIRRMPHELVHHRKELIKFGWNHLKREDTSSKQWAFINVCHFLEAYQAPEKIILQVFVALLRTCQPEARALVRDALDILTPALPNRLPKSDSKYPIWIRYTKKILVEEGHSLPHLIHIWQLLVRHAPLFYQCRAQFVPQMVNSLNRLGIPANSPPENRRLSIDLAGLVIKWAKQAQPGTATPSGAATTGEARGPGSVPALPSPAVPALMTPKEEGPGAADPEGSSDQAAAMEAEAGAGQAAVASVGEPMHEDKAAAKRKREEGEGDPEEATDAKRSILVPGTPRGGPEDLVPMSPALEGSPAVGGGGEEEYRPNSATVEMIIAFLLRMAFMSSDPKDKEMVVLQKHTLDLVAEALQVWTVASVKFSHMERLLQQAVQSHAATVQQAQQAAGAAAGGGAAKQAAAEPPAQPPHPHLVTGMELLSRVLNAQPELFVKHNHSQLIMVMEPVVACNSKAMHGLLCDVMKKLAHTFPPAEAAPDTPERKVYDHVHELIASTLLTATTSSATSGIGGMKLACVVGIMAVLAESKAVVVDRHIPHLVKLLAAAGRKAAANARAAAGAGGTGSTAAGAAASGSGPQKGQAQGGAQGGAGGNAAASGGSGRGGDAAGDKAGVADGTGYGSVSSNTSVVLRLLANSTVLLSSESKKMFPQVFANQLGDRNIDGRVLLACLEALHVWVQGMSAARATAAAEGGAAPPPVLTNKELKHFLSQLAMLRKAGVEAAATEEFEEAFLNLVYELRKHDITGVSASNAATSLPVDVRNPYFLQGLRASKAEMRHKFFEVYDQVTTKTLFSRLDFIFKRQDWEGLADLFWLKQALDLLLAILVEQQPIILAPNSSQIPALYGTAPAIAAAAASGPSAGPVEGAAAPTEDAAMEDVKPVTEGEAGTPKATDADAPKDAAAAANKDAQSSEKSEPMEVEPGPAQPAATSAPDTAEAAEGTSAAAAETVAADAAASPAVAPASSGSGVASTVTCGVANAVMAAETGMDVPTAEGDDGELQALCEQHVKFLQEMGKLQVADLIRPLREVAHHDGNMAYHLWVLVFPIVWATLKKEEQESLAKPMIHLLSKEYHQKQQWKRPNVVQALLEGISLSQPQPKIPAELIKFLGKTYNAWHIAIPLLESHVLSRLFLKDSRCFHALAELYRLLSEEDMLAGLWRADPELQRCLPQNLFPKQQQQDQQQRIMRHVATSNLEETRAGMALAQHGMWPQAQDMFFRAVAKKQSAWAPSSGAGQQPQPGQAGREEMCLWEERWIEATKQLNQWDVLGDFAKSVEHTSLQVECLWRQPDWPQLKEHVLPKAASEESERVHIVKAYVALHEGHPQETLALCDQGTHVALRRWWQLPELGVGPHQTMLHSFQVLMELQESARLLVELSSAGRQQANSQTYNDPALKEVEGKLDQKLELWRLRLPNEWDPLLWWSDLLQWRHHMYNLVITAFKQLETLNPHLHQLGYREKAWSVNQLGSVARRQGLPETCISVLTRMYGFSQIEVQEAFAKVREQAKAYLAMEGEGLTGLNLVNTTNLEYFPQKNMLNTAEIFRLKGLLLQKLGDRGAANEALSHAQQLCKGALPAAWISWGAHCEAMYKEGAQKEMWLENTMVCYMMALRGGTPSARSLAPRILSLLSFDSTAQPAGEGAAPGTSVTGRVWESHASSTPVSAWLLYIPQLLLSLQRPEAPLIRPLLSNIAEAFPQAIYCWLRTFLLERREPNYGRQAAGTQATAAAAAARPGAARPGASGTSPASAGGTAGTPSTAGGAAGTPSTGGGGAGAATGTTSSGAAGGAAPTTSGAVAQPATSSQTSSAFDAAKEVMEFLRQKHGNLASEMEILLTEVGSKFMPLPEERLLAVVHALLHRCYKYPIATTDAVPYPLKRELAGVCRACFSTDTTTKHSEFVQEYKKDFEENLDPDQHRETFPETLQALTEALKRWKTRLQNNVEDRLPAVLPLEEESRNLRDLRPLEIELPGQYLGVQEAHPETHSKLDYVGVDVLIVRRHGTSHRRLSLHGTDGREQQFLVQTSLTPAARSDERMVQLMRHLNRMLEKHKQTRRRHLMFHTPIIVPVWPQV
ncbi:hypothetical protein CYMTET_32712, partial [Cymbomonas tetramitiformis]